MTDLRASPLGHATTYTDAYDPRLIFAVERAPQRAELNLPHPLPFTGADLWTAYELSWLDRDGKPQVAIGTFTVPADSPCIVESKSVKLYLASFNQSPFDSADAVKATMARDLSGATGSTVGVSLALPDEFARLPHGELAGIDLDALPLVDHDDAPAPDRLLADGPMTEATLRTRLFRSVCPITGQPDYATVQIGYRGARIDPSGLLAYLVSYRRHPGLHEQCVERIYTNLWRRCAPAALTVYARFTRRGGLDINPYRTSTGAPPPPNLRTARQ